MTHSVDPSSMCIISHQRYHHDHTVIASPATCDLHRHWSSNVPVVLHHCVILSNSPLCHPCGKFRTSSVIHSHLVCISITLPCACSLCFWARLFKFLSFLSTTGKAPYSSVLTHGFALDEKGLKMSKSMGNVVDPRSVIEGGKNQKEAPAYGADVLRLWVSSVDYTGDVMIGPQILRQISEIYRKLRGTLRYLLANLHGWETDFTVKYDELPRIDRHALFQLENVVKSIQGNYENDQFFKIFQVTCFRS
ncbi:isoleucine--tRNA ligase, chloroplastic/mitochondrial-like isoform X1 [Vicia villosa]|uniref:isoleucine--tRNA ligase, chloroplastic/mitochondrial-like isoform X1 n=2 Tax=Vicia villosa TaxID=3911 RepID=UPI00273AF8DA|nr:isoleucine--tRNA ligase, chloroplastic/mitochondrial-like isoform X1 [Vicia villosa]